MAGADAQPSVDVRHFGEAGRSFLGRLSGLPLLGSLRPAAPAAAAALREQEAVRCTFSQGYSPSP